MDEIGDIVKMLKKSPILKGHRGAKKRIQDENFTLFWQIYKVGQNKIVKDAIFSKKGLAIFISMWYNLIRECFGHRKKYVQYASRRYLAFGENSLTLRLVSKLPDLRVANAKWIQWASSLSRISSSSIIMMHAVAS